jgi:uncharacterized protein
MTTAKIIATLVHLPQTVLMYLVRAYRLLLSPWLGSSCRFTPTCSVYALEALAQHGAVGGSYLTVTRLARCHPWCVGGLDPVPAQIHAIKLFSNLLGPDASVPTRTDISHSTPVSKTLL